MLDLIIGKRELGKTTLAVSLSHHFTTRVIFDPRHMINTTSDILTDKNIEPMLYDMLNDRAEIIIRPHFDKEHVFSEMCGQIYDWLQDHPDEPFCLLIDEARFVSKPEENQYFDYIVRCTNRDTVSTVMTCHGVIDISPDLRRIADYWILFRLTMEADLDRVRERCGDIVADEVQKLSPFEYIVWNDSVSTWRKHSEKEKWYVKL